MRPLEATIRALCAKRIGREPDLANPRGYNDKIQWLKLHDQRPDHIVACDKWGARHRVAELAGADVLIPAWIGLPPRLPAVIKCSHDSGSARLVRQGHDLEQAHLSLAPRLSRPYGVEKGEWAYQFVPRRLFSEQVLAENVDYKFHCAHGRVRWVQVIWDRRAGAREAIFTPEGEQTALHMDEKMRHSPGTYPGDTAWAELTALAEKLAAGWRYVRVDLYWSAGKAWFGELTFWPRAGCYLSKDEPAFGEMLDIDLTERFEPVAP